MHLDRKQMKSEDHQSVDVSSLGEHMSNELSIESLTKVPGNLEIAIVKAHINGAHGQPKSPGVSPIRLSKRDKTGKGQGEPRGVILAPVQPHTERDMEPRCLSKGSNTSPLTNRDIKIHMRDGVQSSARVGVENNYNPAMSHFDFSMAQNVGVGSPVFAASSQASLQNSFNSLVAQRQLFKQQMQTQKQMEHKKQSSQMCDVASATSRQGLSSSGRHGSQSRSSAPHAARESSLKQKDSTIRASRVSKLQQLLMTSSDLQKLQQKISDSNQESMSAQGSLRLVETSHGEKPRHFGEMNKRFSNYKMIDMLNSPDSGDERRQVESLRGLSRTSRQPQDPSQVDALMDLATYFKKKGMSRSRRRAQNNLASSQQALSRQQMGTALTSPLISSRTNQLQADQTAPRTERLDLAEVQNYRLNEMRHLMKQKLQKIKTESRARNLRSQQGLYLSQLSTKLCQQDQRNEVAPNRSAMSLPPVMKKAQTPVNDRYKNSKAAIAQSLSNLATEFNRPQPMLRPVKYTEVPIYTDVVGPCPPHYINNKPQTSTRTPGKISANKAVHVKFAEPDPHHLKPTPTTKQSSISGFITKSTTKPASVSPMTRKKSNLKIDSGCLKDVPQKPDMSPAQRSPGRRAGLNSSSSSPVSKLDSGKSKKGSKLPFVPIVKSRSHTKNKKAEQKVKVVYNEYGAREDGTKEQQVNAIVNFFRLKMLSGNLKIMPGPPKEREEHPKVAQGSDKLLSESLQEYTDKLQDLLRSVAHDRAREKNQIHLGSFNEETISLYQQLEDLKSLLAKARQKSLQQEPQPFGRLGHDLAEQKSNQMHQSQSSIDEITKKIEFVLRKLAAQGPERITEETKKLKNFVSVTQTLKNEFSSHLPDIQKETSRLIEQVRENPVKVAPPSRSQRALGRLSTLPPGFGAGGSRASTQRQLSTTQKPVLAKQQTLLPANQFGAAYPVRTDKSKPASNYFRPYENAQEVAFPEQAKVKDRKLEVFRYDLGEGLIDALSDTIRQERKKSKAINELTLDQNNMSDEDLAKLLDALYDQGQTFHQSCASINISNNEFGRNSTEALAQFLNFTNPDNLCNLRLSNLRLQDSLLTGMFTALNENTTRLLKLRLSGIPLSQNRSIDTLAEYLSSNDVLSELDLSYANLQVPQLLSIFNQLPGALSLTFFSIAFNTIEFDRNKEQSDELLESMVSFLSQAQKLVHLDFSGCNFGERVTRLGPAFVKSLTLQSIHLHYNQIPDKARTDLFDSMRIRLGARQTRTQIEQKFQDQEEDQVTERNARIINEKSAPSTQTYDTQPVDVQKMEAKLAELRHKQLKIECLQFQGVGRRPEVYDKLILFRVLGHQELNLFTQYNLVGWQVSPTDQCFICEHWRYTVFFYDRKAHIKNKMFDCVTRWIMEKLNRLQGSDYRRRVTPTFTAQTLVSHSGTVRMSPMLEYNARLNRGICKILEQTQVNASAKGNDMATMIKFYLQNKVNVADNIALSMDLDVNDLIIKGVPYPDDCEIVNQPQSANYFSREMEDDTTYIWAGFAKPGKHTVVIRDPLNLDGPVQQTFLVGVREHGLQKLLAPQVQTSQQIKEQGASRLDTGLLFGNWKKDFTSLYEQCFLADIKQASVLETLTKTSLELNECHQIIRSCYSHFLKTYSILAAHSKTYPFIDKPRFEVFITKLDIMSSSLTLDNAFEIFTEASVGQQLSRPDFLRAIIMLIDARFLKSTARQHARRLIKRMSSKLLNEGIATIKLQMPSEYLINDMSLGCKHFFDVLLPRFSNKRTWQEFKTVYVQKTKVSQILIDEMTILRRIYSTWSVIEQNKRIFSLRASMDLFDRVQKVSKKHPLGKAFTISDDELKTCWGLSKLTIKDMERDSARTRHMVFVEFLEFICRVAHVGVFSDIDKKRLAYSKLHRKGNESSAIEDDQFVAPQDSAEDDRDELAEEQKRADDSASDESEIAPSQEHLHKLHGFRFLFGPKSFLLKGKTYRRKLKMILSLLPAAHQKQLKRLNRLGHNLQGNSGYLNSAQEESANKYPSRQSVI